MGADLYLISIFESNLSEYQPLFDEWTQRRDTFQQEGKVIEALAAQAKVEELYDKMFERGYFRDSYNSSCLLWKFHLSWWDYVRDLLNEDDLLVPTQAQALLQMLQEREETFEASLKNLDLEEGEIKEEEVAYFRDKYERLKAFLREAIALNEGIVCSI